MSKIKNLFENVVQLYMENHPNLTQEECEKYIMESWFSADYWDHYMEHRCPQYYCFTADMMIYVEENIEIPKELIQTFLTHLSDYLLTHYYEDYMNSKIIINHIPYTTGNKNKGVYNHKIMGNYVNFVIFSDCSEEVKKVNWLRFLAHFMARYPAARLAQKS